MALLRSPRSRRHHRFFGRQSLAILLIAACAWAALTEASASDPAGKVEDLKGIAAADTAQQHRALDRASPIYVGDRVSTGAASRLTMRLGADTTIRLGENTQLVIDKFLPETGGEISLEAGPMLFDRPPGARRMPMQIRSPYAVLAVRGTQFFAGPSNGVFGVFVKSGKLKVSAAGTTVTLSPGQGTNLQSPGAAPTRPVRWGQSRIDQAYASVR
ncbi:MAG TPA: FecR family protein [Pirellulales bacterium]|nr:FecR family protein [Pirellulales bacterium]